MAQIGLAARLAALDLLDLVTLDGAQLSQVLDKVTSDLEPGDTARAQSLATGTLRHLQRTDRLLGPYLKRRPHPRVHNALRLALYEVFADGTPSHAAVHAAVALVKQQRDTVRQAGLVNAVLRRVLATDVDWDALPVSELPKWLRKRLVANWGKDAVAAFERVQMLEPPLDLTPKSISTADLAEKTGGVALPTGSVRLASPGQVSRIDGYDTGDWWVQDAAAALPAKVLASQAGERVLDMCAAPGGKTMQLAAAGAEVTALDLSARRLERVAENLSRTGLSASLVEADALVWRGHTPFDAILLDAPCSATGTLRRHPDLPFAKDGSELDTLVPLQAAMIDAAVAQLAPNGRLVYCTCSLFPEEGEDQVPAALTRHPELTLDTAAFERPGLEPEWVDSEVGLRLRPDYWPNLGGMDGFFVAAFRKIALNAVDR